ncbi:MAG: DUF531 family protein, partial [Candidatus Thermoplasmatota archaeon]|nr:DUF531 family protein [Candidatus Thermoplasmatota archaeon]
MSRIGRMTIGLYNTYDPKRFAEAHRRVLVRVGPVATAFECNVALFGFPFPEDIRTPVELAEWLSAGTSIGEGGQYFIELAEAGRVSLFPYPAKGFPPQFGDVVATTRKPDGKKSISAAEVASRLAGGRSCLLVFGLGPHGLPEKARDICNEHLDITGKGITLETCTALGIVPAVLHTLASGAS